MGPGGRTPGPEQKACSDGTDSGETPGEGGGVMDKILKPGDPCPCCGQPIKTDDPDRLLALNWLAYAMGKGAAHEKIDAG